MNHSEIFLRNLKRKQEGLRDEAKPLIKRRKHNSLTQAENDRLYTIIKASNNIQEMIDDFQSSAPGASPYATRPNPPQVNEPTLVSSDADNTNSINATQQPQVSSPTLYSCPFPKFSFGNVSKYRHWASRENVIYNANTGGFYRLPRCKICKEDKSYDSKTGKPLYFKGVDGLASHLSSHIREEREQKERKLKDRELNIRRPWERKSIEAATLLDLHLTKANLKWCELKSDKYVILALRGGKAHTKLHASSHDCTITTAYERG